DPRHRQQARRQALLPPLRLSRRAALAHLRGDAAPAPRADHQAGGEGHDAPQPARAKADHEAEDLRRSRASARGAEARADGDRRVMAEKKKPQRRTRKRPADQEESPQAQAPETEAPQADATEAEAPRAEAPETEAPQGDATEAEAPRAEAPEPEAPQAEAAQVEA